MSFPQVSELATLVVDLVIGLDVVLVDCTITKLLREYARVDAAAAHSLSQTTSDAAVVVRDVPPNDLGSNGVRPVVTLSSIRASLHTPTPAGIQLIVVEAGNSTKIYTVAAIAAYQSN